MEQKKTLSGQKTQVSKADSKKLQQLEREENVLTERLTIAGKNNFKTAARKGDDLPKPTEQSQNAVSQSESLKESLKTPEPQISEAKPLKKTKQVPAGTGALVAQAE